MNIWLSLFRICNSIILSHLDIYKIFGESGGVLVKNQDDFTCIHLLYTQQSGMFAHIRVEQTYSDEHSVYLWQEKKSI
jgi:hypothetical protein